jgi:hypothetical protein
VTERAVLASRVEALITAFSNGEPSHVSTRDALIDDLAAWQATQIDEYGRLQRHGQWPPAMPTDVFRFRRVASHPTEHDIRVFRSSGTTSTDRSMHVFADLSLYDLAARVAARHMLFPDLTAMRLVILAPREDEALDSSLDYMLARFAEWFGSASTWVWRDGALDLDAMTDALLEAEEAEEPIALLGTSFAFVHAEDGLGSRRFALPEASRVMQTGGYKGKSREVEADVLLSAISTRYGVHPPFIINEFGATELSSQMYETTLREAVFGTPGARRLWVPPWVRATPVDPDSLRPVDGDAVGLLRIDDCANVDSVCCIQTGDLARRLDDGIVVLGRDRGATARGCSLAADQALGPR